MDIGIGKRRHFPAVAISAVLFLLCIFLGQFWVTKLLPATSGFVQIKPSLVFMDIPIAAPFTIDLLLVTGLFLLIYPVVILCYPSRPGIPSWRQAIIRARNAFMGLFALLFCMLAGGYIYYMVKDQLSVQVRNGIDSIGINADIHLPFSGFETIPLRGSLVLFVCFVIGLIICIRKIRKEPGTQTTRLTREQRMTPYERMLEEKRMGLPAEKKGYNADKSWQPVYPKTETSRPVMNEHPQVCYHQPIFTFTPVAVRYMPL
jgi:hypothetical protein